MALPYVVSVRSLCEFTAKTGDLSVRFTPSPTARQGIAGHNLVAARRGARYLREVVLSGTCRGLMVRGRADGYDPQRNLLEEFKTHRGDLQQMPANQRALHWAQLKTYGALLCEARQLATIDLALVYFDVKSERETSLTQHATAASLQLYFEDLCTRFQDWAARETTHRVDRDRWLASMPFPHQHLRTGQRRMAEAVYRTAVRGNVLMVQAPTGIGKTIGTLFPLLKAAPKRALDKIFFLVAKTPGRGLALDAVRQLAPDAATPLRTLELAAKETVCHYPGRACEAASCPLARGFYDRLPAARERALAAMFLDRATVRRVALEHEVCPYYLGQELARWCDIVIGDYSYFFDVRAILHAFTTQNEWRVGVLVDEAHNLLPRARDMYSAVLEPACLATPCTDATRAVKDALLDVQRVWRRVNRVQGGTYAVHAEVPPAFLASLQRATAAIGDDMTIDPGRVDAALMRFYFDALHFCRMADDFGDHSLFDVTQSGADSSVCIRNVNPGPFLRERFSACKTAVVFSATFAPQEYYRQLLGLPNQAQWIDVESPFNKDQLQVRIRAISTRYHDRSNSLDSIVELMELQYRTMPGNYLAFFSSFDYLRAAATRFSSRFPGVRIREQVRGMTSVDRDEFLAGFTAQGSGIGFAVLGGAFAEGIDLPGTRLIGAFIATLGLPQVNDINTEIERRLHALFGRGYEYTYLYPGLQKVVQAAGRVIRTTADRGTVYLIDDRYTGARVRALLPQWWHVRCR